MFSLVLSSSFALFNRFVVHSKSRFYFLSEISKQEVSTSVAIISSPYYLDNCERTDECECQYGFKRKDFKNHQLLEKMKNDGPTHDKHIFLSVNMLSKDWPSEITQINSVNQFSTSLKNLKNTLSFKPKLTLMESSSIISTTTTNEELLDVLVFPEGTLFSNISTNNLDHFIQSAFVEKAIQGKKVQYKTYIFICTHEQRDKRCGYCGSVLIDSFHHKLKEHNLQDQVFLGRTSHVGGHVYAGNVIIFQLDEATQQYKGDWYGFVDEKDVETLIQKHIIENKIVHEIYRGSMK